MNGASDRPSRAGPPVAGPRDPAAEGGSRSAVPTPVKVLYIAGIGRSGSTLLNRALGTTPGFFAAGELMHFFGRGIADNELCACGTTFRDCEVWGRVIRELGSEADLRRAAEIDPFRHEITEGRHLLTTLLSPWKPRGLRERLTDYRRTVLRVYRAVQRVTGGRVLVDSSKNLSYARVLQEIPELRVFVVHLVRDPRGVAYSMSKKIRRPGVPWREEYLSHRGPLPASMLWMLANLSAEWLRSRSEGYLRVRYSDFVGAPAETLRRILRTTGEEASEGRLAHIEGWTLKLGAQHILSGNPVRARVGEIPLHEDVEWRRGMEATPRRLVTALTLPFLLRYGFPPSPPKEPRPSRAPEEAAAKPSAVASRLDRGVAVGASPDGTR